MVAHSDSFSFRYSSEVSIFENAQLAFPESGILGLLGANGAGKTTLLDLLTFVKKPNSGSIQATYDSDSCFLLVQSAFGPPLATVGEYARLVGLLHGASKDLTLEGLCEGLAEEECERLRKIWRRRIGLCSRGEWQWFCVVLTFSFSRRVYFLDEPTAGVDPEFRYHIWKKIDEARRLGGLIVVSSHLLDELERHVDELLLIRKKKIERFRDMAELMATFGGTTPEESFIRAQR